MTVEMSSSGLIVHLVSAIYYYFQCIWNGIMPEMHNLVNTVMCGFCPLLILHSYE